MGTFVLLLDLVRRFRRLVALDQSPLVPLSPLVVVPLLLSSRCSSHEANSVPSPEMMLFRRHEVNSVSAPRSSVVPCEQWSTVSIDHHPQSKLLPCACSLQRGPSLSCSKTLAGP